MTTTQVESGHQRHRHRTQESARLEVRHFALGAAERRNETQLMTDAGTVAAGTQWPGHPAPKSGCNPLPRSWSAAGETRRRFVERRCRDCPASPVHMNATWLPSGENDGERTTPGSAASGTALRSDAGRSRDRSDWNSSSEAAAISSTTATTIHRHRPDCRNPAVAPRDGDALYCVNARPAGRRNGASRSSSATFRSAIV